MTDEDPFNLPIFRPPDAPPDDEEEPAPQKNKGGAPKGNTNALKHGFYSRRFKVSEIRDLDSEPDLDDEIKLLRVCMRRISEQTIEFTSLEQRLDYLQAISQAAYTITRMLKIRKSLGKSYSMEDYFKLSMEEAINAIRQERGWK
jgi:hypothetical protein